MQQQQQRQTPGAWEARTNLGFLEIRARLQLPKALRVDVLLSLACGHGIPLAEEGAALRIRAAVRNVIGVSVRQATMALVSFSEEVSQEPTHAGALSHVVRLFEKLPTYSADL